MIDLFTLRRNILSLLAGIFISVAFGNESVHAQSNVILPPPVFRGIINIPECTPAYPRLARRFEIQGRVLITYEYDESGTISNASVSRSAGPMALHKLLDDAVLEAIKRCKVGFVRSASAPPVLAQLTPGRGTIEFPFTLQGEGGLREKVSTEPRQPLPNISERSIKAVGRGIDLVQLSRLNDRLLSVWTLRDLPPRNEPAEGSVLDYHEYDCGINVIRLVEMIFFRLPRGLGDLLYVYPAIGNMSNNVSETTPIYPILREACQK